MEFFTNLHQCSDCGLIALRVAIGVIFLYHGKMKMAMWGMKPSAQMPAGMISLMKLLSICEPLGAVAVLSGFLTQLACIGLSIIMVGAAVMKSKTMKIPFASSTNTGWEFDFMILAGTIALTFFGAGKWAIDHYIFNM